MQHFVKDVAVVTDLLLQWFPVAHSVSVLLYLLHSASFVNSGNTMNKSFQRTDTVFWIDEVDIVTKNILELDIECR